MTDDPYVYPGTDILRNKLDLRDARLLDHHERALVTQRAREGIPAGQFDLAHLQAIHRHLFQDVYDWAGAIRTVDLAKGPSHFQHRGYIETGMADIHRRLRAKDFLKGTSRPAFASEAATILGDVNYVHPFREGNGRTQLQYLKQLALHAGHPCDLGRIPAGQWVEASIEAQDARYESMAVCIAQALMPVRARAARDRGDFERER